MTLWKIPSSTVERVYSQVYVGPVPVLCLLSSSVTPTPLPFSSPLPSPSSCSVLCECALSCCGVFHAAHLLHVEMRRRYVMVMGFGSRVVQQRRLSLTSSSTNRYWRALPDGGGPSWFFLGQVVLDGGGRRSSTSLLFSESSLMVPFPPLGPLVGSFFSRPQALTPRTRKWKSCS